ncbi:hypothetical protein MWU75_07190 [Ornithinimicrobium sp. F0845]|uniref:hypothetical protein n=1 Tax=Ornithinimicrobium sp. F0845 TaxID=2926412 RepID=UPI001FF17D10|nr:hypothetical protein [Ornithinimicrobium sp. F0845]MCK0111919.1 hypothetical protein [Ornithinimicrobium sp. F0845]
MSTLLMLVLGELLLRQHGFLLVLVWLAAAALAQTPLGEWWASRLFYAAQRPLTHQRYTLAPVADVLLQHHMAPAGLQLLVGRWGASVNGLGRRTLVVTRDFVDLIRCGELPPRLAAAAIAHELSVMRAGLTRTEPALHVLLAPWHVWLSFMALMWGSARALIPLRLMQISLVTNWGVGLWLGYSDHPAYYAGSALLTVALLTWWAIRSAERAREAVGDLGLIDAGLATVYADHLTYHFTDDYTLDRAVRLRQPGTRMTSPPRRGHPWCRGDYTTQSTRAALRQASI